MARVKTKKKPEVINKSDSQLKSLSFILTMLFSCSDGREGKDVASTAEELELELEALDITEEPLELEGPDEAENEELAKKLLDEQGKQE